MEKADILQRLGEEKAYTFTNLCKEFEKNNLFDQSLYTKYDVKRGLRNADGSGVMAGITNICCVHGYVINESEVQPIPGELIYRGYHIQDIVEGKIGDNRYGFEETAYLLLFGALPNAEELEDFNELMDACRCLPDNFTEDVLLKLPSPNIMNKMAASLLALYSTDKNPENNSLESEMRRAIQVISCLPSIMVNAYQVKRRIYDNMSMVIHPINSGESLAQSILSTLRDDRQYTEEEAKLLDMCLVLHAEHGGGNNSTFACRTLTSSGTDAYSAYSAAIGSLKGPRHGGANIKVMEMLDYIKEGVSNWGDDGEVADFLNKLIKGEAGDRSGLIYGMGHAVYTLSDPRTVILKKHAIEAAKGTGYEAEFKLLDAVERLTPEVFAAHRGDSKQICANVDMYSGLVYKMLNIPSDLYTPLFAVARMPGWCAHRMEEIMTGKRIIRPAYKAITKSREYVPITNR